MIELLQDLPGNVLGFRATGRVTAEDYETILIPAVEERLQTQPQLRFLYVLGEGFEGFDARAMWDDAKVGLLHLGAWERIAVATDASAIGLLTRAFGFLMPCPVRVFAASEEAEARAWVSA